MSKSKELLNEIAKNTTEITTVVSNYKQETKYLRSTSDYMRTIESQARTIEVLTDALCDKYKHGLFIVCDSGKFPIIIQNGKKITDDNTTAFSINWDCKSPISDIEIKQSSYTDCFDKENE